MIPYDYKAIEKKWQKKWEEAGIFHAVNGSDKPKFYALVEFPYPSGQGLHVGHPRSYTALDRKGNTTWLYDAGEDYRQVFQLAGGRGVAAVSTEKFVFYSITERTEEKG